jgi:KipI family sensor histidine kinase inhibitor
MFKQITQVNEQSFLIDFGSEINIEINTHVNLFFQIIISNPDKIRELNILNCVPSFNKILIQFDFLKIQKSKILDFIKSIKVKDIKVVGSIVEIPICYDGDNALDIDEIIKKTKLSKNKLINIHLDTSFHVYMIGFVPGLPFMGDMDNSISIPRKNTPRAMVPKGSVGIVDKLSVIYPQESPGGWNIIGRTPISFFFNNQNQSLLINPGDKVKFNRITQKEFNDYG